MTNLLRKNSTRTFLYTFILACFVFVPFMVMDRGYFLYFGDFNVQQVPFYKLAHEAVRSGNIFWNWHTDLGVNFIGSYSFYLLFSPFFWLTLPFPTAFVPHLMGPLLILKTACAALTAFHYVRRFVRDERYAILGGILYAFSGTVCFNIFFNHFHEAIIFFPLLLIALEELIENDRRGWFAAAVALNCMVNYWFFIGEVVFVVIYFFVRASVGDWPVTFKKFLLVAFESALGVLIAMAALLPSVLAIMDNPRVGDEHLISGWLMWIYGYSQRLPAIWASFFFPPELPSQPNLFPDMGANWSSMSTYFPLFSLSGVIAFLLAKKRNFLKRMILISALMASIPVLNSAFVLFNVSYYARWYYMPILLMSVATVIMLEDYDHAEFMRGVRWTYFITVGIGLAIGLTPNTTKEGEKKMGLMAYPERFWAYFILAIASLAVLMILLHFCWEKPWFLRAVTGATGLIGVGICIAHIAMGQYASYKSDFIIDTALNGRYELTLPDDGFARSDIYKGMDNLGMYWGLPNIQAFHSIAPGSLMEFYPAVGIKRDVSSKPSTDYPELRALLSVRWFFMDEREADIPLPGYVYHDNQLGYNIYENEYYLPMGFGYDACYDATVFERLSGIENTKQMLRELYLDEEAIARNEDILAVTREINYFDLHATQLWEMTSDRMAYVCDSFEIDNRGFTATANLDREVLMFFSVPYDKGWTAIVNGEPAHIEKANIGFMAVRAPAGPAEIRFSYMTPGLLPGMAVTATGIVILAGYLLLVRGLRRRSAAAPLTASLPDDNSTLLLDDHSLEDYLESLPELPKPDASEEDPL